MANIIISNSPSRNNVYATMLQRSGTRFAYLVEGVEARHKIPETLDSPLNLNLNSHSIRLLRVEQSTLLMDLGIRITKFQQAHLLVAAFHYPSVIA